MKGVRVTLPLLHHAREFSYLYPHVLKQIVVECPLHINHARPAFLSNTFIRAILHEVLHQRAKESTSSKDGTVSAHDSGEGGRGDWNPAPRPGVRARDSRDGSRPDENRRRGEEVPNNVQG